MQLARDTAAAHAVLLPCAMPSLEYLTNLRARLRCGVTLLLVADNEVVVTWARTPIVTGHPGWGWACL